MRKERKSGAVYPTFSFDRGAVFYILLLLFAVIFTQALHSSVSTVFFWLVLTLPVISFIYALLGRANVGAFILSDETTAEKLTEVGYEFRVANYSILPLPFTEAELFLPTADGVLCRGRLIRMSMLPRGEYYFRSSTVFPYRGDYKIGVGCVYVSDFLRIFRLRRRVGIYSKIHILPRRLTLTKRGDNAPSDIPSENGKTVDGIDSSETNIIREYRAGDPLKHIHWKLSSKVQDLQVNEYKPSTGKNVYVFCDFVPPFDTDPKEKRPKPKKKRESRKKKPVKIDLPKRPVSETQSTEEMLSAASDLVSDRAAAASAVAESRRALSMTEDNDVASTSTPTAAVPPVTSYEETPDAIRDRLQHANDIIPSKTEDINEYCADGVSELAVAAVTEQLSGGNTVTLVWFDERAEDGFCAHTLRSYHELEPIFKDFGTAPFAPPEHAVTRLPALTTDAASSTFIYATSGASLDNLTEYVSASNSAGAEKTEILLFDPVDRFEYPELHSEYIERCRTSFAQHNITLTDARPSWEIQR